MFANAKRLCDQLERNMPRMLQMRCAAMHGDKDQHQRNQTLDAFKHGICFKGANCDRFHSWCRNGNACSTRSCGFRHSWDPVWRCWAGDDCENEDCPFVHSPDRPKKEE